MNVDVHMSLEARKGHQLELPDMSASSQTQVPWRSSADSEASPQPLV